MKSKLLAIACVAIPCFAPLLAHAAPEPTPEFPIARVVQLSTDWLAKKKTDAWIESIVLSRPALFSSERHWIVTWSHSFPGYGKDVQEVGMSVKMDGSVVHLVKQ